MIRDVLIGSDPEFFISNGKDFIPSIDMIPGTKYEPYEIIPQFFIQKDNVLIEGNIPPAKSKEEFVFNMKTLKALMNDFLKEIHPTLHIVSGDSAEYSIALLQSYPEAMEFGCDPYLNVWTNVLTKAKSLAHSPWRTAGFHIHVGYSTDYDKEIVDRLIVKAFDYFVTSQARKIYNDNIRSYYYGELGAYRVKPYGVECRSLGGYFTKDEYLEKVYDATIRALEYVNEILVTNRFSELLEAESINELYADTTVSIF